MVRHMVRCQEKKASLYFYQVFCVIKIDKVMVKNMIKYGSEGNKKLFNIIIAIILLIIVIALYYLSRINYLLFHTFVELFAAVVAITIFSIGWNTRKYSKDVFWVILSVGYMMVGVLTIFHILAFSGMNIFPDHTTNLATQFWISTRYIESITLLIASILFGKVKRLNIDNMAILVFGLILSGLL